VKKLLPTKAHVSCKYASYIYLSQHCLMGSPKSQIQGDFKGLYSSH